MTQGENVANILVRTMCESDLVEARRIFRVAFGTFLGLPDPEAFCADREYIVTRWRNDPHAALVAEIDGKIAGSNFATNWGSFGFFGPLTVRPELWNQRVAQALLSSTMEIFNRWKTREIGLFTFAHSPKHIAVYQKFGFWPRFLTALMSKRVNAGNLSAIQYSSLNESDRQDALNACRNLTDAIHEGLDVSSEIRAVVTQNLGETLLFWGGSSLDAFAVCHCGEFSEAGTNNCFIKFAAVRPGASAESAFERLLDACEGLAAERALSRIEAGVNLGRSRAYRQMLHHGFRTDMQGVAMHRPDTPAFNVPDVFVLDDWR